MRLPFGHRLGGLLAVLLGALSTSAARADAIFANVGLGVGEYTTSGATVNASLISTVPGAVPEGIAVSGSDLFVASYFYGVAVYPTSGGTVYESLFGPEFPRGIAISGADLFVSSSYFLPCDGIPLCNVIGEYTTSGAVVNGSLITGLSGPEGIAVVGSLLFVVNAGSGTIGEYTTSGATVNASLISGLNSPLGIAISGSDLFVTNESTGTVGEYTTSGAIVNASLVTGLSSPGGIAVDGSDLFVTDQKNGLGEYTTSGAVVNASLIPGLGGSIAIVPTVVPEPSTLLLVPLGLIAVGIIRRVRT